VGLGRRIAIALVVLVACGKDEATVTVAPAASASAIPVDHLGENELLEGDAKAFGLTLPRGVSVKHGFDDLVIATGNAPADKVANYVRQRVKDGKITVGARATVFEGVRVVGTPDMELSVRVEPLDAYEGVRIELRRLTQEKAPVLPDDEARWRAAGLKPNGQPLDPKKLR
jgi:hypothetical protein